MDSKLSKRYLNLLKLDAETVYDKISLRKAEYIDIFAQRRTREHFPRIFENRFSSITYNELSCCSEDTTTALISFYKEVDEIYWYLYTTQDMPSTVSEKLDFMLHLLETKYKTLSLYLDAQFAIEEENLS